MEIAMNKRELKALNTELVDLLTMLRDQIDEQLEELAAVDDDDEQDDEGADDDEAGD
jgi:hypothetical protein